MTPSLPDAPRHPDVPEGDDPRVSPSTSWRERVTAYLDGALPPEEAREVLAWLEAHPDALREVEEHRRVWALLGAYRDEPVPTGFAERVISGTLGGAGRVAEGPAARSSWRVLAGGRLRRSLAVAAGLVAAVGVGAFAAHRFLDAHGPASPASGGTLEGVPSALLESDDIASIASYSDEEFEALLTADPEDLAQAARARGG